MKLEKSEKRKNIRNHHFDNITADYFNLIEIR